MLRHLQREIEQIKRKLLTLCATVEKNVAMAVRSIEDKNDATAREIIATDVNIDHTEVDIEEDCLKILALYQPVAIDLRVIVAVLKINNDLERIADLAVNIAERSLFLMTQGELPEQFNFPVMTEKVMAMLRDAVNAFVALDAVAAHDVCKADDEVDDMNRQMYRHVESLVKAGARNVPVLTHLLSVSRHLERIADHATNIAEDVIYMITGEIVRHHVEDYTA